MSIADCWQTKGGVPSDSGAPVQIQGLECLFQAILNNIVAFAGVAVLVMFIIGGFKYLTSGGDPKATESARNTITYAIAGLALLLGAWFILLFIKEFTGIDVTIFEIPGL